MRTRSIGLAVVTWLLVAPVGTSAQQSDRPPAQMPNQPRTQATLQIQGFHIVLVVGETQGGTTSSSQQLPEGAARALNDMREFLPYKHYRVLDAQWSSCCSGSVSRISGRLQGVLAIPGPDGQARLVQRPYMFHLTAGSAPSGISTRFTLVAPDGRSAPSSDQAELERRIKNAREDLATMESRLSEARARLELGLVQSLEVREVQDRHRQVQREVEALQAQLEQARTGGETGIMDSNFTMAPGETVVVGTSRLGGDKALIALVTAVPKGTK